MTQSTPIRGQRFYMERHRGVISVWTRAEENGPTIPVQAFRFSEQAHRLLGSAGHSVRAARDRSKPMLLSGTEAIWITGLIIIRTSRQVRTRPAFRWLLHLKVWPVWLKSFLGTEVQHEPPPTYRRCACCAGRRCRACFTHCLEAVWNGYPKVKKRSKSSGKVTAEDQDKILEIVRANFAKANMPVDFSGMSMAQILALHERVFGDDKPDAPDDDIYNAIKATVKKKG